MKKIITTLLLSILTIPLSTFANEPAVEMRSLLDIRLMPSGNMMFSEFRLFFPPAEPVSGRVELLKNGETISSRPIAPRYRNLGDDNVIAKATIEGIPVEQLSEPGEYIVNIIINDKIITRFPFSLDKSESSDPFAPADSYEFNGPWNEIAYLKGYKHRDKMSGKEGEGVSVVFWPGQGDSQNDKSFYVHAFLNQNGKKIAHSKLSVGKQMKIHKNLPMFTRTEHDLYFPHEKKDAGTATRLTFADLSDGDYELTIVRESDGATVRSYSFAMQGGSFVEPERAMLTHEPHADLLVPRALKTGSTNDEHQQIYWLLKK